MESYAAYGKKILLEIMFAGLMVKVFCWYDAVKVNSIICDFDFSSISLQRYAVPLFTASPQ